MRTCFVFLLILPVFVNCQRTVNIPEVSVPNQTLIACSNGKLINFNLDAQSVCWEYVSEEDLGGNRNCFTYDEKSIYLPFESGKLISVDVVSGKVNWVNYSGNTGGGVQAGGETSLDLTNAPYYMSMPLVWEDKIYIAAFGQPESYPPTFFVINKEDGSLYISDPILTNYNLYKPVICRDHIFVNSAVYLSMYSKIGAWTNYGMHSEAAFESPLYYQMQSDGKTLYLGEEDGRFYALPFTSNAVLEGENDITDPENNFRNRKELFKWVYQSSAYPQSPSASKNYTALVDDIFIVNVKKKENNQEALVGINTNTGKEQWIFEAGEQILNQNVIGNEIIGYTNSYIFVLNMKGELKGKYPIDDRDLFPLSNIVSTKTSDLLFSTTKGIVFVNRSDKTTALKIPYDFTKNHYNIDYVHYFGN